MREINNAMLDEWVAQNAPDESLHIRPMSSYVEELIEAQRNPQARKYWRLPWGKCFDKFDLRPSEVTLWLGFGGHGKSLLLGQVMTCVMAQGAKVCIASLEMRPAATVARMIRQASGGPSPSEGFHREFADWSDGRAWIYDQHGQVHPNRILALCRYAREVLKVDHLVCDSLMRVVADEDDYNGQKRFVDALCVYCRDTGLHVHLVHHSRKLRDETVAPGKQDAKGSGALGDLVDNCVSVWRRREEESVADKPDAMLRVDKQRHGEWDGNIGLWFHPGSLQFVGGYRFPTMDLMGWHE